MEAHSSIYNTFKNMPGTQGQASNGIQDNYADSQ